MDRALHLYPPLARASGVPAPGALPPSDCAADALLDPARLHAIAAAVGAEATAHLVGVFAAELVERPAAIRRRVAGSDLAGAAAAAHELAGAARSIGAGAVADAARQVELAAGPGRDVATCLPRALAALSRAVDATLAGLPSDMAEPQLRDSPSRHWQARKRPL